MVNFLAEDLDFSDVASKTEQYAGLTRAAQMQPDRYQYLCDIFESLKPGIKKQLRYFRGRSADLSEDLLQEGYLALWQAILDREMQKTYEREINTAIASRMQAFWRSQTIEAQPLDPIKHRLFSFDKSLEEIEANSILLNAVESLPKKRKAAIHNSYRLIHSDETALAQPNRTRQAFNRLLKKSLQELAQKPEITELR